jgi:hypothetical protein
MRFALIGATLILPLAACSKEPTISADNATPAEVHDKIVAAAGSDAVSVQPGLWQGTMTIEEMEIPGLPPEAQAHMKAQTGNANAFTNCVTEEDVKNNKAFFTGDEMRESNCKYDRFDLAGGKVDAAMSCDQGQAGKLAMTMTGSYSPDRYEMAMTSRAEGAPGPGMTGMTMKMKVDAKRIGACPAR